jgi:hypothetical protein
VFEFDNGEDNIWFEDAKLVKEFYWRKEITRSPSGKRRTWEGLISDPVRIQWKAGMDPTKGLLDAACDLADAEKAALEKDSKAKLSADERLSLPEYEKLVEKVAQMELEMDKAGLEGRAEGDASPVGLSFFAWFGYRGKDINADESKLANKEDRERWDKIAKGEEVEDSYEDDDDDDDEDQDDDGLVDAEIFPDGEELAIAIGEDIWPNALKYYGENTSRTVSVLIND